MKLAVLSDVHGTLAALRTVVDDVDRWGPDRVVVAGDVVNRGPESAACLALLLERRRRDGWVLLRGNHDAYVAGRHGRSRPDFSRPVEQLNQISWWTCNRLGDQAPPLAGWPTEETVTAPDGSRVLITHASRRGQTDGLWPWLPDRAVARRVAPAPDVFVSAHLHLAFRRRVGDMLLVNTGSAGTHCYGETRATYARLTWRPGGWAARIRRLTYDRAATRRAFDESGLLAEAGPLAPLFYYEWWLAEPLVNRWLSAWQRPVTAGELPLQRAVDAFVVAHGLADAVPPAPF